MISRYPSFFLQYRDRVERPATWLSRHYWIISRGLCGFRRFRLPNSGRTELKSFAALKAREWAPYEEVGFHLHLTRGAVGIWAWDATRIRDAMLELGLRPGRLAVVPEGAVRAPPSDGVHLIACLDGVEGQFWSEGELQASRWWVETPSREQWLDFQRASGAALRSSDGPPPAEQLAWRRRPWTNAGTSLGFGIERRGREAAVLAAGLVLAAYGYVGGSFVHTTAALSEIKDRLRSAERRSDPIIAERSRALANLEYLSDFGKLNPYPSQFALLARVAEKLPPNGARLTAWSYQDGDLQFTVLSPVAPDILFYVKAFSSVEGFTNVTADRADTDRSLRIKLRLARP
jgi:hypothetical protein